MSFIKSVMTFPTNITESVHVYDFNRFQDISWQNVYTSNT